MMVGIINYSITYMPVPKKVCISSTNTIPATIYTYTEGEIRKLISESCGQYRELYKEALKEFPNVE